MGNGLATRKARRIAASGKAAPDDVISCPPNAKSPPVSRAGSCRNRSCCGLAAHAVSRNARNVDAHDAEIGKLAVGEQIKLALGGVVAIPALEAVGEEVEHCLSPMD